MICCGRNALRAFGDNGERIWRCKGCGKTQPRRAFHTAEAANRARLLNPDHPWSATAMQRKASEHRRRLAEEHLAVLREAAIKAVIHNGGIATTGQVEQHYRALCAARSVKTRGHTQFWAHLHDLGQRGELRLQVSGKGYAGRTTLVRLPIRAPTPPKAHGEPGGALA